MPMHCARFVGMLFAFWLLLHSPLASTRKPSTGQSAEQDAILAQARPGDLVLRRGKGLASDLIVKYFPGSDGWSHAALVVSSEALAGMPPLLLAERIGFCQKPEVLSSSQLFVVHSVDDGLSGVNGVQVQSLGDFLTYSVPGKTALYRPRIPDSEKRKIQEAAIGLLCRGVPFDRSWSLDTQEAVYCTEFLKLVLEGSEPFAKKNWTVHNGILDFANFCDSGYFEEVKKKEAVSSLFFTE